MGRKHWDCWETDTPPTTSMPPTSTPPSTGGPEPEFVCHPPRIEDFNISPTIQIDLFITGGN